MQNVLVTIPSDQNLIINAVKQRNSMNLYAFFFLLEIGWFQLRMTPDLFVKNVLNYLLLQIKIHHRWFSKNVWSLYWNLNLFDLLKYKGNLPSQRTRNKSYWGYSYDHEGSEIWMISETTVLFVKISVNSHVWQRKLPLVTLLCRHQNVPRLPTHMFVTLHLLLVNNIR